MRTFFSLLPATAVLSSLLASVVVSCAQVSVTDSAAHYARLSTDKLHLTVADNEAYPPTHRAGYSGVAELRLGTADAPNLFVPLYAGLNFEHIFSGDADSFGWNIFEPRRAPMQLRRLGTNGVELFQERTEHWPLRSRLIYTAHGDAVELTFHATPLADAWKKHGYIGIFFASYIQSPEDLAIQFIGRLREGKGDTTPRWIKHVPERHGLAANHRPAGSRWDPPLDAGFNIDLVQGISDFEYLYPFYFGRSGEHVFVLMFERPHRQGEMRFAQSPSGGGKGNPAWDFAYFRRRYVIGQEFSFRVRAVYRKFTSVGYVVRLYEKWSGDKVRQPK